MQGITHNRKIQLAILLLCLILGAYLRFWHLGQQSYWMDEGYTINAILDASKTAGCALYCYPTAFLSKVVLGQNAFAYRFEAALAGSLFILLAYFITRKIFNKKTALLSAFFISLSYWQIAWSRQARWYTIFELFFWLSLYFFYQFLYQPSHKIRNIILTIIFTALTIYSHGLGYLLPVIFIGWYLIDLFFIKKHFSWRKISFWGLIGIIVLIIVSFKFNPSFHYVLPYYLNFYLRNYWLFIIPTIIALFLPNQQKQKEMYFFLFAFAAYLIPLSFLTDRVEYRYLFHLTPVFYILGAWSLASISWEFILAFIAIFFISSAGILYPAKFYFLESDNPATLSQFSARPYYAYTPQPDWNSAYAFINLHQDPSGQSLIISSMPQFNRIFLNQSGYWLKYNYLNVPGEADKLIKDGHEYYVGAQVIDDLADLKNTTAGQHGFIVFDYSAIDGGISEDTLQYIQQNFSQVFYKETNSYSKVWVWRF